MHLLGNEMRFTAGQALLTRLVLEGAVGDPQLATFVLHVPMLADPASDVPAWWGDPLQGGGWLGAHGSHVVDQALTMFGAIDGVSASTPHVAPHAWTAEDAYLMHFRTASGVTGVIESVASDRGRILSVTRVAGSSGTAWTEGDRVFVADEDGRREIEVPDGAAAFRPVVDRLRPTPFLRPRIRPVYPSRRALPRAHHEHGTATGAAAGDVS